VAEGPNRPCEATSYPDTEWWGVLLLIGASMGNATQGMHARSRARACRDGSNEDYVGNAKRLGLMAPEGLVRGSVLAT
jgi:hypothetical protein